MGYLAMFFAGFIAGMGYVWFQNKTIWDNVEMGCLHGCLVALGALAAVITGAIVIALRLNYWGHIGVLFASFYGTFFLFLFCEYLEELWKNRSP